MFKHSGNRDFDLNQNIDLDRTQGPSDLDQSTPSTGQAHRTGKHRFWLVDRNEEAPMKRVVSLITGCTALLLAGLADAHTLQIQCKKASPTDVVCRGLFSDGEVARAKSIQIIDENSDKVLATGKTDVEGKYSFKAPGPEYAVVIQASKGEVASISAEDIW
jgi:hypothetical protein